MYAATHPHQLAGVVLADTFTPELFDRREWPQRSVLLRATVPPVRLVGYERVERAMVWLQERIHGENVGGDYERIERFRAEGPRMDTDEFTKVIRAVASFHGTRIDLSAITVPALVVYGEHEPPFISRHGSKLGSALPNASVREVPDAGHASDLDDPEFFTDVVREFLARVRPSESGTDHDDGGMGES